MLIGGSLLALMMAGLLVGGVLSGDDDGTEAESGPDDGVEPTGGQTPGDGGTDLISEMPSMVEDGAVESAATGDSFGVRADAEAGETPPSITDWDTESDQLTIYYPPDGDAPDLWVRGYAAAQADGEEVETGAELLASDESGSNAILRLPGVDPATLDLDAFTLEPEPEGGVEDPGTDGDDVTIGGAGDDDLSGGDGDDQIIGGPGADTIDGGTGDDVLAGRDGPDDIFGDAGVDAITGGGGNDSLDGGSDPDYVFGNEGDDMILGRGGNDYLSGDDGNDTIDGGTGSDRLLGGDGDDTLDGAADADLLEGGAGDDTLLGGSGDDNLVGGRGSDVMEGGAGMDLLDGTAGQPGPDFGPFDTDAADVMSGGEDSDMLILGAGDTASGDGAADIFAAGAWIAPGADPGTITDFDPSEDVIRLFVPDDAPAPDIAIADFPDGSGADILLDGQVVLRATGAQGLDPAAIEVVATDLSAGPTSLYA